MKRQKKLYHLVYYRDTNTFQLSEQNLRNTANKLRVTRKKITEKQADAFVLHFRHISKKMDITNDLILSIYRKYYYECNVCGKVYRSTLYREAYKKKCRECYANLVSRLNYNKYHRKRHEKVKTENMKEYIQTTQLLFINKEMLNGYNKLLNKLINKQKFKPDTNKDAVKEESEFY